MILGDFISYLYRHLWWMPYFDCSLLCLAIYILHAVTDPIIVEAMTLTEWEMRLSDSPSFLDISYGTAS